MSSDTTVYKHIFKCDKQCSNAGRVVVTDDPYTPSLEIFNNRCKSCGQELKRISVIVNNTVEIAAEMYNYLRKLARHDEEML